MAWFLFLSFDDVDPLLSSHDVAILYIAHIYKGMPTVGIYMLYEIATFYKRRVLQMMVPVKCVRQVLYQMHVYIKCPHLI